MLAEHNVALFNTIIPLIYQHLPSATVGNTELLRITLLVLLPDAVSWAMLMQTHVFIDLLVDGQDHMQLALWKHAYLW